MSSHLPRARRAVTGDLVELVRLHDLARDYAASTRGGDLLLGREGRPAPVSSSLEQDLAAEDRCVVVGALGDQVVGFAVAALEELHDGTTIAHVHELFVEPDARDVGVGAALMDELIAWARERGCAGIGSMVLPGDRDSKNFFESFGLVARAILVHRDLTDR